MKIALAQINTIVGDVCGNRDRVLAGLEEAGRLGAELALFPEALLGLFEGRTRGIPALHPDGRRWHWLFTSSRPHALSYGRRDDLGPVIKMVGSGTRAELAVSSDEAERWSSAVRRSYSALSFGLEAGS